MPPSTILESCIENFIEAKHAFDYGADQLEVCSHLDLDGLTPDESLIAHINQHIDLPVKIMIRSRGGDFYYSDEEIHTMVDQIKSFKKYNIIGFVFGALVEDKHQKVVLDMSAIYKISKAAGPYPITIHKAIDLCFDIPNEVQKLKTVANIKYILTSGGKPTAIQGSDMLKQMSTVGYPNIEIIAAGKITHENLNEVSASTGLQYFHGRKIV